MRNIRVNLNDIIDSKIEGMFIYTLYEIEKKTRIDKVTFWMDVFSQEIINDFMNNFIKSNNKKIDFIFTPKYPGEEFVWFDIIDIEYNIISQNRFSYVYSHKENIIMGLHHFYNVSNFIDNSKTYKKVQYIKEN